MTVAQPLKWHGGKSYLAKKIIGLMPRHLHYVEPFAGGLSVLLNKAPSDARHQWGAKTFERGISEVVNDLDGRLMNFWRVLQDGSAFQEFTRIVQAAPFSESAWEESEDRQRPVSKLDTGAAVAFFIRCRQSRAGGFNDFATLSRNRTRRQMNEQASAWLSCVKGLPAIHERLKRVVILCRDALDIVRQQDCEKTLFYLDPPYLPETRASNGNYAYEMTENDHRVMLNTIKQCCGAVLLSGYANELYDRELREWNRHDFQIDNKVSGAKSKRTMTESVWCNF